MATLDDDLVTWSQICNQPVNRIRGFLSPGEPDIDLGRPKGDVLAMDQAVDGVLRSVITSRVCYRLQHGLGTSILV